MNHAWTTFDHKSLIRDYANTPNKELAERFGVTIKAIENKARELGLRKSKEYCIRILLNNQYACKQ